MSTGTRDRKLRVLTISDGVGSHGGAEALAREIAQRLDPERFESTFCATRWDPESPDGWVLDELDQRGVGFIGMERRGMLDLVSWRRLITQMRSRRIDILHSHKIGSNFWASLIAPRVPVDVFVAHEHSWSYEGQPRRRFVDRHLIGRRADAFIAVSQEDRRRMIEIERIPASKARFIQNGIPEPRRSKPPEEIRAELGFDADRPLVGMVATLRPEKNYEMLISSMVELRERVPGVGLVICGGEESVRTEVKPRLEALAHDLGLDETVYLLGFRADAFDVVSAVDVACLTSDREGSPLSVMEYMEAAKPVVASRVGGVPDLVVDGETGLLVERRDRSELIDALASLLLDRDRALRMGRAGQQRRRRLFSIETTTRAVENLYLELHHAASANGS